MTALELLREKLERAGRALGIEIGEEAAESLFVFLGELAKWNKAYNLVGRRTTWPDLVDHCIDSLSVLLVVKDLGEDSRIIDIGTGAGFPGIPLYLTAGPFDLVLLEVVRKKVAFLRHVKRSMELEGVQVLALRAEAAARQKDMAAGFDLALMRAVADWRKAVLLGKGLVRPGGEMVMLCGPKAAEEMGKAGMYLQKSGFRLAKTRSSRRLTGRDTAVMSLEKMSAKPPGPDS